MSEDLLISFLPVLLLPSPATEVLVGATEEYYDDDGEEEVRSTTTVPSSLLLLGIVLVLSSLELDSLARSFLSLIVPRLRVRAKRKQIAVVNSEIDPCRVFRAQAGKIRQVHLIL